MARASGHLCSWQIQARNWNCPISSDEKQDRSVSWLLRLTQRGVTQSWCHVPLLGLQSEGAVRNCLKAFRLILCKPQSSRKVKYPNIPFSCDPYKDPRREVLSPFDR